MQFKLYTTAAVGSGTYIWGETRTAGNGNAVTVTNGLFNVLIGEGTAVAGSSASLQAAVTANSAVYLEVTVGGEILSLPGNIRSQFGSSAYSVNSDFLDGLDSTAFSQLSTANAFTNTNSIDVSSANAFTVKTGSSNMFNVDTTGLGKVTIGVSDTTGTILVLDVKTDAGDPTGSIGAMYYNSNLGKFRCYQVSAWVDCIGAATSLNNLTTTSINQSLIASSTNAIDLGSSGTTWRSGYFGTSVMAPLIKPLSDSATSLRIQNAAATLYLMTFDTASVAASKVIIGTSDTNGTVLVLDVKTDAGDPTGSIGAMYYNSNLGKFRCYQVSAWVDCIGANYALSNLTATSINQSLIAGTTNSIDLGASGTTWRNGYFGTSVTAGTSVVTPALRPVSDGATALQIQNAAGTSTFLNLNTTSSQIEIGSSALAGKLAVSDGSSNFATITVSALANSYTVNIPTLTANDTICLLTNGNCVTTLQGGYNASTGGTTPEIKVSSAKGGMTIQDADTTIAGTLFSVTQSNASNIGTAIFSVSSTGAVSLGLASTTTTLPGDISSTGTFSSTGATALFRPSSASQTAFSIETSGSQILFAADTQNSRIYIGNPTADSTAVFLVLDSKNTTGDPTGVAGAMYYNTADGDYRAYQGSNWATIQPVRYVYLSSDTSTTSTTYANAGALNFSVEANKNYELSCSIIYRTAATTTGIGISLNGPSSPVIVAGQFIASSSATALNGRSFNAYNGGGKTTGVQTAAADMYGLFNASFRNGANAGTLAVRYATEISTSAVTLRAGTYCKITEL